MFFVVAVAANAAAATALAAAGAAGPFAAAATTTLRAEREAQGDEYFKKWWDVGIFAAARRQPQQQHSAPGAVAAAVSPSHAASGAKLNACTHAACNRSSRHSRLGLKGRGVSLKKAANLYEDGEVCTDSHEAEDLELEENRPVCPKSRVTVCCTCSSTSCCCRSNTQAAAAAAAAAAAVRLHQSLTWALFFLLPLRAHKLSSSSRAAGANSLADCRGGTTAPTRTFICSSSSNRSSSSSRSLRSGVGNKRKLTHVATIDEWEKGRITKESRVLTDE
ncbi:hypothetical protein Emed_003184 [Eimeria media]